MHKNNWKRTFPLKTFFIKKREFFEMTIRRRKNRFEEAPTAEFNLKLNFKFLDFELKLNCLLACSPARLPACLPARLACRLPGYACPPACLPAWPAALRPSPQQRVFACAAEAHCVGQLLPYLFVVSLLVCWVEVVDAEDLHHAHQLDDRPNGLDTRARVRCMQSWRRSTTHDGILQNKVFRQAGVEAQLCRDF